MRLMRRILRNIPIPFWCYVLPMVFRTVGLLPEAPFVYGSFVKILLPAALILLLLSSRLSSLFKIGTVSLVTMCVGSLGILLGGPFALFLFRKFLPENAWMGFGTLAGSWTGGSINMAALKEAIGTPPELFSPMVFVDSVIAYSWMGLLLALAPHQERFDRWNHSKKEWLEALHKTLQKMPTNTKTASTTFKNILEILGVAALGTVFSLLLARQLPSVGAFTQQTWLVLLSTTLAIVLSFTPLSRLGEKGASQMGTLFLYMMLIAMGAQADLKDLVRFPQFVLVGVAWVFLHGGVLLLYGKIFRVPLFFLATASQANIGGVVSAPMVAACYEKNLAPLGLLLAIFGNLTGTYLGLLTTYLMRLVIS